MHQKALKKEVSFSFAEGVKDCIPTLFGYISVGIAAGVVGTASHLSVLEVGLLAVLVYAGSAQFIIAGMLAAGSPVSAIILTTFIVNLRHLLLSSSLAPALRSYSVGQNIGFGLLLTDESYGVAYTKLAQEGRLTDRWMHGLNVTAYVCWIFSCIIGAAAGSWIGNPETYGLDYALDAMFIALFILQLYQAVSDKWKHYITIVLCMVLILPLYMLLVSSYAAVILATVTVATIGVWLEGES